jgi:hypothetical protein
MLAHQIDKAMVFLDSACLVIGTLSIGVVAWASYQNQRVKKKLLEQGKTRVAIWDTKVALRRVETVFDRYFWGSYWQPGRTFQEVMGELTGTPLEKSLEALKKQCVLLDQQVADGRHWLNNARELYWVCERVTWVSSPRPASRRRWVSLVLWPCRSRDWLAIASSSLAAHTWV